MTYVLLAIVSGETYWLYRLGAFNAVMAWATAAGASGLALAGDVAWSGLPDFVRGLAG